MACDFNPLWIHDNRFCDGYFQGTPVDVSAIENTFDNYKFAISSRKVSRPSGWKDVYWNNTRIAALTLQYNQAIALANEKKGK